MARRAQRLALATSMGSLVTMEGTVAQLDRIEDPDRAAVIAVVEAETQAFFDGDLDRWSDCFLHDPRMTEVYCTREFGLKVIRGWDSVFDHMRETFDKGIRCLMTRFENSNYLVSVDGQTAWTIYEQKNLYRDAKPLKRVSKFEFLRSTRRRGKSCSLRSRRCILTIWHRGALAWTGTVKSSGAALAGPKC